MRGFTQNIRNGNNFALINSEIRWPFVRYFAGHPLRSNFLNSLQIVGFGDIGTAWTGAIHGRAIMPMTLKFTRTVRLQSLSIQTGSLLWQDSEQDLGPSYGLFCQGRLGLGN